MPGSMMKQPLLISDLIRARYHGDTEIVSKETDGQLHVRDSRLALIGSGSACPLR